MDALGCGNRLAALGPSEGGQERGRVEGRRANVVVSPDLIKGPFATDGWLFVGDFVKDFSVVDGLGSARTRHRRLLVFLSLRGHPGRFTFDCALIDRPKFHFDYELFRPEQGSFDLRRLRIPLRFRTIELHTPTLHFFYFSENGRTICSLFLDKEIAARYCYDQ